MAVFNLKAYDNHEQIVFCHDQASGLHAIICVHDTTLGPAVGGCRMWDYNCDEGALIDALRLSKGMTYKNAMAGLKFGGGKSVIIGNSKTMKSDELFRAFGRCLNNLNGKYITAEDVGITTADMAIVKQETDFVLGLEGRSGDPSPLTAYGVFRGIQASVKHRLHTESLEGISIAVQGVGHVGYYLCKHLHEHGAKLFITDINQEALDKVVAECDATIVDKDHIYDLDVDIYSPCALGATLNNITIPKINAKIIAGAANNQLAEDKHGQMLMDKGILYAPDYVINAGGIINVYMEYEDKQNYNPEKAHQKTDKIYDTLEEIFSVSQQQGRPTNLIADELAKARIAEAK